MDVVMDELLLRLEPHRRGDWVVLGVSVEGCELRAAWHERGGVALSFDDEVLPQVTVCAQIPDSSGCMDLVLCRGDDSPRAMAYHTKEVDAAKPDWALFELAEHGVRLQVRWVPEGPVEVHDYAWTTRPGAF